MKTIMKKIDTKQIGIFVATCAVLFAAILLAVPSNVSAKEDDYYYGGASYDYYDGGSSWDGGKEDDYYYGGASYDSYDYADDYYYYGGASYDSYDYADDYKYASSDYKYASSDYYTSCSTCGGYSSYVTPTYSYSCGSSCGGSSYSTPRYVSSNTPSYSAPSYVYTNAVANANAAANANSQSNSASNSSIGDIVNNNVNNNTVVVNVPNGGTSSTTPTSQALDGYCVINPNTVNVNQDVSFSATASGGNGNYTYSWSGSDGIYSNSQSFTGRFSSTGTKNATVTIQSGNQTITRSCNVNVQNQYNNNISAYCVANPSVSNIGQTVTWTAYVNGGTYGNYSYSWSGSDNLYGNGQSVYMTYNSFGSKTANVTIYGNGQTVTASCNMTVQGGSTGGVTVIRTPDQGTPVSGVYLSQIPATGIDLNLKTILFSIGLIIWSAFIAYVMINRRKVALAGNSSSSISKAEAFKIANMKKNGIIA